MNKPKISIITPSFNSAKHIEEAIQSVLKQGYPNFEHIIVDGGSKDGTLDVLKNYPHLKWVSEPDRGQSHAMNKGFSMSGGDIVAFLNADDFFSPGAFKEAVDILNRNRGVLFVAGACNTVDLQGKIFIPGSKPRVTFLEMMHWWKAWFPINPSAYFYFREIQEKVGGFNENDHYMMDYDFLLRVSLSFQIKAVDRQWGNFRWYGENKSSKRDRNITRELLFKCYKDKLTRHQRIKIRFRYIWETLTFQSLWKKS